MDLLAISSYNFEILEPQNKVTHPDAVCKFTEFIFYTVGVARKKINPKRKPKSQSVETRACAD